MLRQCNMCRGAAAESRRHRNPRRGNHARPTLGYDPVMITRRSFLGHTAVTGALLLFVGTRGERAVAGSEGASLAKLKVGEGSVAPLAFVSIAPDGTVTIVAHRSEMGTGIRTTLPMALADELDADWTRVKVVQAPGDEDTYGGQNTDGSHSLRDFLQPMRVAGASTRYLLISAAATAWGVPRAEIVAEHHQLRHAASGRTAHYGEFAAAAAQLPLPEVSDLVLKREAEFRYIGKRVHAVDLNDIVHGAARYGIDSQLPGMRHAVIARPPVYGGRVVKFSAAKALAVKGVEQVVKIPGPTLPSGMSPLGGVAVIATNTWAAMTARDLLEITWNDGHNHAHDTTHYAARLAAETRQPAKVVRHEGDVDKALAAAATRVTADYSTPYLTHAPMEPPAALALVRDGRCEVWAPVQDPQTTRKELAALLKIPFADVRVNVTLLGGGFGRKSMPDFVLEAAYLSRATGHPVKVTWSRSDEIQHGFYHSIAAQHAEAALDANGRVTAWLQRSAFPPINSLFKAGETYAGDEELAMGFADMPYQVPNVRLESAPMAAAVRIGWFRSVVNIQHGFAAGSFVDELAHAAKRDPREFLIELLGPDRNIPLDIGGFKNGNYDGPADEYPFDTGRIRRVVELATREAGWGSPLPAGTGRGLAVHRSFLTTVAVVVQATFNAAKELTVDRVDIAIDCGYVANPERVHAQLEGAVVMGLTLAMRGRVTFKQGRAEQSNFNDFPLLGIHEVPKVVRTHIVPADLSVPPAGVGEPGVPPMAPALCNAIYAATGKRIRHLPIADQLQA